MYAPKVLMVYADWNNAKFWKPFLNPYYLDSTPVWRSGADMPLLTGTLYAQLAEMFGVDVSTIVAAEADISFAYV